jgi:hypothetical protein
VSCTSSLMRTRFRSRSPLDPVSTSRLPSIETCDVDTSKLRGRMVCGVLERKSMIGLTRSTVDRDRAGPSSGFDTLAHASPWGYRPFDPISSITIILNLNMPPDVRQGAVYQLIPRSHGQVPADTRPCIASVLRERGHVYRHGKCSNQAHAARSDVPRFRGFEVSIVDLHDADAHIIMIYTLRRSLEPRKIRACTVLVLPVICML